MRRSVEAGLRRRGRCVDRGRAHWLVDVQRVEAEAAVGQFACSAVGKEAAQGFAHGTKGNLVPGNFVFAKEPRFLGFVSEEEKRRLLRSAWAVVFPSPKEGWGISNVEAAACGTGMVSAISGTASEPKPAPKPLLLMPKITTAGMAAP